MRFGAGFGSSARLAAPNTVAAPREASGSRRERSGMVHRMGRGTGGISYTRPLAGAARAGEDRRTSSLLGLPMSLRHLLIAFTALVLAGPAARAADPPPKDGFFHVG